MKNEVSLSQNRNLKRSLRRQKAKRLARSREERYRSLVDIGIALSTEKELQVVLDLILEKALETTRADAASIYLTENVKVDPIALGGQIARKHHSVLRFHRSANRRKGQFIQNKVLELDSSSIAGYVASTGIAVCVADCQNLPPGLPYRFNADLDKESGYQTKTVLAVPMVASNGRVRGVLQMINKVEEKSDPTGQLPTTQSIVSFNDDDLELMQAFASQACVAIENAKLTEDIENLFESFIRASVTAIEARDPATSGHSDRVAVLTVELARAVHQVSNGPLRDVVFSEQQIRELRYAALLHDFGKIGVRESVLTKPKKLYPHEMEVILSRLESARARQEMLTWREMAHELVEMIESQKTEGARFKLGKAHQKVEKFAQQVQQLKISVLNANQPLINEGDYDTASLISWITKTSQEIGQELITSEELIKLSVPRGSLTAEERREIESHVTHTYHFLRQIAWTEDLSNVADIAHAHHEKCDGTGYPRGITSEQIPVQSRMMAISDIYDALTSMDRPYKKALDPQRAIDMLLAGADDGKLDFDLIKVFIEAEIYRSVLGMTRGRRAA